MIADAVDRYLAMIRAGGGLYREDGRCLALYTAFAQSRDETHVTTRTALEWARQCSSVNQRRKRLLTVRRFALAMSVEDPRHEVPPADLLPRVPQVRRRPYIYSPAEIASLLAIADQCGSKTCPVPGQYRILFSLIVATGLRRGEALAINIDDITPDGLMVRPMKRSPWRCLPLHPSVETELQRYLQRRVRIPAETEALFLNDNCRRLNPGYVRDVFLRMLARTGLAGAAAGGRNPRIHDFRHTFAVRSLESCGSEKQAADSYALDGDSWNT